MANAEKEKHIVDFDEKGYLNFMLSPTDISNAKKIYDTARTEIEKINYDIDFDILKKKESAHRNSIIGFADSFLNSLWGGDVMVILNVWSLVFKKISASHRILYKL